jgi:ABC-2 type transport system ATP-binding protein
MQTWEALMPIIEAAHLNKSFTRTKRADGRFSAIRTLVSRTQESSIAVEDVSFSINEGEIVGYLGPNGAGKSTTIKMLTGILVPSSGSASVAGLTPWADRERNAMNIGVVFGQRSQLWWDLPLDESFNLIARMYRIPADRYRRNLEMLTVLLDMEAFLATPVRQLSLGQRMRGDLAAAALYEPPILFLDEPTVGLDVVAKERMRGFIEQINAERKTTVLLTTHDLDDVERLCRRIIIIDQGRVLFDGPTAELKARYAPHRLLDITVSNDGVAALRAFSLSPPPGVTVASNEQSHALFHVDPNRRSIASVIAELSDRVPVVDLSVREPEMDGIVREIYETKAVKM